LIQRVISVATSKRWKENQILAQFKFLQVYLYSVALPILGWCRFKLSGLFAKFDKITNCMGFGSIRRIHSHVKPLISKLNQFILLWLEEVL